LAVTFAPTLAAPSNFNVICMVRKKPTKLTLNVKGEGYAVHDSLQIEGADGRLVELSPDAPNHLDFGQVSFSLWLFHLGYSSRNWALLSAYKPH